MEPKQQKNKERPPISRNDFLTLFGLMLFDDEARRISAEMDEEDDQEVDILDLVNDDFDEPDEDPDDEYEGEEDDSCVDGAEAFVGSNRPGLQVRVFFSRFISL